MKLLFSLFIAVLSVAAAALQGSAGPYRIDLRTDPPVVPLGRAKLLIALTDASGKPVPNASVRVIVQMPGMPMGEREETATAGSELGTYTAPAVFGGAGSYQAKISISGLLGAGQTNLSLATGETSAAHAGAGLPVRPAVIGIVLIGGIVL